MTSCAPSTHRLPHSTFAPSHETLAEQTRQGREMLARERVQFDAVHVIHSADMQFQGQSHILSVPLQTATPGIDELQGLFEAAYWKRFEVELPEIRAVLVNLHTTVLGRRPGIDLAALAGGGACRTALARSGVRSAAHTRTPAGVARPNAPESPAIIEQRHRPCCHRDSAPWWNRQPDCRRNRSHDAGSGGP